MDFRNKKIIVIGLANSGIESALALHRERAIVSATDNSSIPEVKKNACLLNEKFLNTEIGKHTEDFLHGAELLVVSPGVDNSALPIRYAEENKIPIISELELGFLLCKGDIIAVTGTNGKSTVVSLLGEMLKAAKIAVNVCGNIGNSLSGEVGNIKKETKVILEVSSFQLERIKSFKPKISLVLNMKEDHFDRHKNFKEYFKAKKRIFENQDRHDFTILNYDDESLKKLGKSNEIISKVLYFSRKKKINGIYLDKDGVKTFLKNKIKWLFKIEDSYLKGEHNEENILAASLVAVLLGIKKEIIEKAVKNFKPLSHRFETVGVIDKIKFIDDSKATNVDATCRALQSIDEPTILIAGGKNKGLSYDKILPILKKKVKEVVLIGEAKDVMHGTFKKFITIKKVDTLPKAVEVAYKDARSGDIVLLSPMCSSFDMFKSYKERGSVFKKAVGGLRPKK